MKFPRTVAVLAVALLLSGSAYAQSAAQPPPPAAYSTPPKLPDVGSDAVPQISCEFVQPAGGQDESNVPAVS